MAIFSNPLFASYSVYVRNASLLIVNKSYIVAIVVLEVNFT